MPCRLNPVTPLNTSRYGSSACVQLCPRVIGRGPASHDRPVFPPSNLARISSRTPVETSMISASRWQRFVHPEGQLYFVLTGEIAFDIVTEENIEDTQTQDRILDCIAMASKELYCHDIKIPPRCELFLQLGDDHVSCDYYFVDHIGKILFWLEDVCTEFLHIQPAASSSHLEMQLERLYWVHLEYFPMHHSSHEHQFSQVVDDIYNIMSHGQADRLTSNTSTFPYTADTCGRFLELLSRKRGQQVDGYTLCYAARLAGTIAKQRFLSFYGQRPAQLDRLQEMFSIDAVQHKWLFTAANLLMWGIPQHYNILLDDMFVNEQVYADQWTRFVSVCLADWTSSLSWSFPVFISSILLANVHGGSLSMSVPPALSSAVSIASASCLHLRHQPLAESSATVGARYLHFAKSSSVAFLSSSVAFSLPRASYMWSVSLLTAQFLFVASHGVSKFAGLVAGSVVVAMLAFVVHVIHPEDASIVALFQSLTSLCVPRLYASDAGTDESVV